VSNSVSPARSLLVVRLGAMGDVIHTLAAVSAVRNAFPDIQIGWTVEQRWVELLCAKDAARSGPRDAFRPVVDFVHVVDTKAWRKSFFSTATRRQIAAALAEVRDQQYDVAVDFQGAIKSAVVARLSGAKQITGMARPREWPARMLYTQLVETKGSHVIDHYHSLAEATLGKSLPACLAIFPADQRSRTNVRDLPPSGERFAVINPGAGWAAKQWPADRYGAVAKALAGCGFIPLVNFGPGEEALAFATERASGGAARPISGTLGELIALLRRARLFIGGDTGPLHLAAALQVPIVAIFGPTDPARNGPFGTRSIVLRNDASRNSLSHTSDPDPGLLKITADEVITAARRLLEESPA